MRIFVLLSRIPYPLEKGDKLRAYYQVKQLHQHHTVHLCCLSTGSPSREARATLETIASEITVIPLRKTAMVWSLFSAIFSRRPFQVAYFYQKRAKEQIDAAIMAFAPDHLFCQLIRCTEYVKDHFERPKTLDYMDALSKGMERRIDHAPLLFHPLFRSEYKRLVRYENLVFEFFDQHTIISEQDRDHIYHQDRKRIHIVRNGVDLDFFSPIPEHPKRFDLVFTGNMRYPPNVACARFLVHKILPRIRQTHPDCKLLIAGADPGKKVRELAGSGIEVSGWMPDIREAYAMARIFTAPMYMGSGLQNKLLEAMAMGIPCVTSEQVNNALGANNGEEILVGEDPGTFANLVRSLMNDTGFRDHLGKNGLEFVRQYYDQERIAGGLKQLIENFHGSRDAPSTPSTN